DVKGSRCDPSLDGPVYGAGEDVAVVSVQAEDEAAVDHDAEAIEPAHHLAVATAEVLALASAFEAAAGKRFEPDEQAPQSCGCRFFDQIIAQDRVDRCGCLKHAAHPLHAAEQISHEPGIPEKVIVQEVEVSAGKAGNFGKCVVHELGVKRAPTREECVLVAEGAVVWATSRYDNRVGHQVAVSLNEIPTYWRQSFQCTHRGFVAAFWCPRRKVSQELGECVLSRSDEDRV